MDDFLLRALLAGLGVAAVAGPLGCFVVWRRMAYFGDTLAHASLLGVALGLMTEVGTTVGIALVCVAVALALANLRQVSTIASDTMLGILSHGTLAVGLVVIGTLETVRVDLLSYLFGDILAVTWADLALVYGGGALLLLVLMKIWRAMLAITVHEELAAVEGVRTGWARLVYTLMVALVIAVGMKVVGIILITSMLIIPAAAARRFARTPESMALLASLFGVFAVLLGLGGSMRYDMPSGPAIVAAAFGLFVITGIVAHIRMALKSRTEA
ncbi:MAG: hypothetical protein HOH65_06845 [Rhodospirillaceae bacterium]|jgi:zinc transport system permease protein|nr:hypothetical protein [Rhodospirillaceae bacterium]